MSSFFEKAFAILKWIGRAIVTGPRTLRMLCDGHPISRGILLGAAGLASVAVLWLVIYYLRCIIKKKKENPGALIAVLLIVCVAFVLGARMKPAEAVPVTVDGTELLSCGEYSLSRGHLEYFPSATVVFLETDWFFSSDVFSYMVDDSTLLQLSGLRTLGGADRAYRLSSATKDDVLPCLCFSCVKYKENETVQAELEVYVLRDRTLSEEPWFLEAGRQTEAPGFCCFEKLIREDGSVTATALAADYRILENDGETITFLMTRPDRYDQTLALCMARQYGDDIVAAVSFARSYEPRSGSDDRYYDPEGNVTHRSFLLEPLQHLFDGNIRLIAEPTEKMLASALPGSIANCPCWLFDKGTRLSIPCERLLEMTHDDTYNQILRFTGPGPDGETCVYTLLSGSNGVSYAEEGRREHWNLVYKRDKTAEDSKMSQFLGAKAVRADDGWVVKMGTFIGDAGVSYDHYYYLTVEPMESPGAAEESAETGAGSSPGEAG